MVVVIFIRENNVGKKLFLKYIIKKNMVVYIRNNIRMIFKFYFEK